MIPAPRHPAVPTFAFLPGLALMALTALAALAAQGIVACKPKDAGSSGNPPGAAAQPPVEGELVISATLKEIPGPFPANDIYNYSYVMKYEVDQVIKGTWADKDILVGHYNPRLARDEVKDDQDAKVGGNLKSFNVGDRHRLVLTPLDGVWTGAIEDDFYKDKRPRHWALWVDRL